MIYAINYSNSVYKNAQALNSRMALLHGAERVIEYSPEDIDSVFYDANKKILSYERGNGYWLWKPYFIKKTLEKINDNDYLIYSDSGAYYINNVNLLIECMERENTDIMVFSLSENTLERMWSKRDAFILLNCDSAEYANTPQRLATFVLLKKTERTYDFITEWLTSAQDIRIITDEPNCMGKENYPDFRENRHDQTILSLLSKKYKMKCFRDPSVGAADNVGETGARSNYPQIFQLHRVGDIRTIRELEERYRKRILELFEKGKKIILYGAGRNAGRIISFAKEQNMTIDACVVSDDQVINGVEKDGVRIYHISEIPFLADESKIIVTIRSSEVVERLRRDKFSFSCVDADVRTALRYFENAKKEGGI